MTGQVGGFRPLQSSGPSSSGRPLPQTPVARTVVSGGSLPPLSQTSQTGSSRPLPQRPATPPWSPAPQSRPSTADQTPAAVTVKAEDVPLQQDTVEASNGDWTTVDVIDDTEFPENSASLSSQSTEPSASLLEDLVKTMKEDPPTVTKKNLNHLLNGIQMQPRGKKDEFTQQYNEFVRQIRNKSSQGTSSPMGGGEGLQSLINRFAELRQTGDKEKFETLLREVKQLQRRSVDIDQTSILIDQISNKINTLRKDESAKPPSFLHRLKGVFGFGKAKESVPKAAHTSLSPELAEAKERTFTVMTCDFFKKLFGKGKSIF